MSKLEGGKQAPSDLDLQAYAAHTSAGIDDLRALAAQSRAEFARLQDIYTSTQGAEGVQALIGAREASVRRLVRFQPNMIVALVQTEAYARAVLQSPFRPPIPRGELTRAVAARMRRQALLFEGGRQIDLLMGEAALWIQLTDLNVHLDQLTHLAEHAESAPGEVTIGVIPQRHVRHPFTAVSGFTIYDELVTIETLGGDLDISDPAEVANYTRMTDLLKGVAVTATDAATMVRRIRDQIATDADPG